ncbi:MAG: single-stranded DNA-binding protein [Bifidobacterium crudilactis]|nr:single-stranded DNA-binding protein [Bifidobacterium crudilactis]MCI1664641.1 single-stranded DNA-binding protein [Bifidobacterium crudilactis]
MSNETVMTMVGNLTADPEIRTTSNGGTVANFTIASTVRVFNRNSQQWEDGDALFLRCSAWDSQYSRLASNIQASLAKGMRVIARGAVAQRSYKDCEGHDRTVVELKVSEIGPALSKASAQVTKQTADDSSQGNVQRSQSSAQQSGGAMPAGYQYGSFNNPTNSWNASNEFGGESGEPSF